MARHPKGYFVFPGGDRIEGHPDGLKGAVDAAFAARGGPAGPSISTFVSIEEVEDEDDEGFVWGAIVELEEKETEARGCIVTRAQKKGGD